MKLTISIVLLFITTFAFSQVPEDVNGIKKVCYSNEIKGDWLVHRIHGTDTYEVILNHKLLKDKKARMKASNEAYFAYVKMRKLLLTKKPSAI